MTKYLVKIPIYKYNTGRADNGNTILEHYEYSRESAIATRDRLITIFNRDKSIDLPESEFEWLQEIIDWQGYMIDEPYISIITEKRL